MLDISRSKFFVDLTKDYVERCDTNVIQLVDVSITDSYHGQQRQKVKPEMRKERSATFNMNYLSIPHKETERDTVGTFNKSK